MFLDRYDLRRLEPGELNYESFEVAWRTLDLYRLLNQHIPATLGYLQGIGENEQIEDAIRDFGECRAELSGARSAVEGILVAVASRLNDEPGYLFEFHLCRLEIRRQPAFVNLRLPSSPVLAAIEELASRYFDTLELYAKCRVGSSHYRHARTVIQGDLSLPWHQTR